VSNLDYMLYLNLAAGRSFNDLTQWPVMPWILRDYGGAAQAECMTYSSHKVISWASKFAFKLNLHRYTTGAKPWTS
jgi:hypothetical protein